jgi:hypothetical protein
MDPQLQVETQTQPRPNMGYGMLKGIAWMGRTGRRWLRMRPAGAGWFFSHPLESPYNLW